jgi:hypothetical protein
LYLTLLARTLNQRLGTALRPDDLPALPTGEPELWLELLKVSEVGSV